MSRFKQLWNDSKTGDILKSGICKDTVTLLVCQIAAVTDIEALDQSFCCELHKKFRVPLPNIRTLVSKAIFYLKHREDGQSDDSNESDIRVASRSNAENRSETSIREMDANVVYLSSDSNDTIDVRHGKGTDESSVEDEEDCSGNEEEPGENENTWEVIDILTHTIKDGVKLYRVQWKTDDRGEYWSDEENWVEESQMKCPDLVRKYEFKLRDELRKRKALLLKEDLKAKRKRERKEKARLPIAEDKDICSFSDDDDSKKNTLEQSKRVKKSQTRIHAHHDSFSSSSEDASSDAISPRKDAMNKPSTSKEALITRRICEVKEKIRLPIADDNDICTVSDTAADPIKKKQMCVNVNEKPKTRRKACYDRSSSSSDETRSESISSDDADEPSTSKCNDAGSIMYNKNATERASSRLNVMQGQENLLWRDEGDENEPPYWDTNSFSMPASAHEVNEQESVAVGSSSSPLHRNISVEDQVAEQHVLDTEVSSWTQNWYTEAESGETKALERNLEPFQCILYQNSTDPNGYGRCLFLFMVDYELKADWIYFPFTGEHKVLFRELLNSFLEKMQGMALSFNLQVNQEKEKIEKQKLLSLKTEVE